MLQVLCPSCKKALQIPETARGKQVRCPLCQGIFEVAVPTPVVSGPRPSPAPPPPSPVIPPPPSATGSVQVPPPSSGPSEPDFDFAQGGRSTGQENLQFESLAETGMDRIRARNRARSAATWAYTSVGIDFLIALIFVINSFAQGAAAQNRMAGLACFFVIFVPIVTFVLIGVGNLTNLRGKGLVITGAIMALVGGALLVVLCFFMVWVLVQALNLRIEPPLMFFVGFLIYIAGATFSILAGIKILIAVNNPDIRAFFPGSRENPQVPE